MHNSPFQIEPGVSRFLGDPERVERVVTNFGNFLKKRWSSELPAEKAYSLFPLVGDRRFTDAWGKDFCRLVGLLRQTVVTALKSDFDATLSELAGGHPVNATRLKWELDRPLGPAICRADVVIPPEAAVEKPRARVLELNLGPGFAGMLWCEQLAGLYRSEPLLAEIFKAAKVEFTSPYQLFAKLLAKTWPGKTVAILETELPYMFSQATAEYLNRYRTDGRTLSVGTYELEPQAKAMEVDTCRLDVVYPNVLPNSFAEDFLAPVWKAEEAGHLAVLGQHLDVLFGAKSSLAFLYQRAQRGELDPADRDLTERFLPPSFVLKAGKVRWRGTEVDAVTFCQKEKDSLVLKLAVGAQAGGIALGRDLAAADWRSRLDTALAAKHERWVVQEFAPHPLARNYYWSGAEKAAREFTGGYHVCPFLFGEELCYGIRLGVDSQQTGPLVAPDDGSCSINLIGLR